MSKPRTEKLKFLTTNCSISLIWTTLSSTAITILSCPHDTRINYNIRLCKQSMDFRDGSKFLTTVLACGLDLVMNEY